LRPYIRPLIDLIAVATTLGLICIAIFFLAPYMRPAGSLTGVHLMPGFRLLFAGIGALLLVGRPAFAQRLACEAPQKAMLEIDLLFGRNIGMELGVSEANWSEFVASEITPRFPQGLTIDDALGQWRDPDRNTVVQEPSKDVQIIVPADAEVKEKIDAIVAAYKQRFQQQSVGVVIRPACVAFE
jgi:hypothetical protein